MGKQPVLGLVGLCVGLTLSGCNGSGSGGWWWGSRKEPTPAVAKVKKPAASDSQAARIRTVPDRATAATGTGAARVKSPYDFDPKENSVPAPKAADSTETMVTTTPKAEEKPPIESVGTPPAYDVRTTAKPAVEKKMAMPPASETVLPEQPISISPGEMPGNAGSTAPVEARVVQPGQSIKEFQPAKMAPALDPPAPEMMKSTHGEPKFSELQAMPSATKVGEPAGMSPGSPAPAVAPIAVPAPTPVMEVTVPKLPAGPPEMPGPTMPSPASFDIKGPAVAPMVPESKGPQVSPPSPPVMEVPAPPNLDLGPPGSPAPGK